MAMTTTEEYYKGIEESLAAIEAARNDLASVHGRYLHYMEYEYGLGSLTSSAYAEIDAVAGALERLGESCAALHDVLYGPK